MLRIVFFGTPHFAKTVLEYLIRQKANIVAVVTKPDKPRGRSGTPQPPPVKVLAEKEGIPVYQPIKASQPEFADFLKTLNADLFVVVAYSEIFKDNLLNMPLRACINVHASLLPKYRGAAPIQRSIMEGEKESGVTIMAMARELDAGKMLAVARTPISEEMTSGELAHILSKIGAEALWKVIQSYEKGEVLGIEQNPSDVTYAKKLTLEDGKIDWRQPAKKIHDQIRGVTPRPGAWCWVEYRGERKRLLIKKAVSQPASGEPGALLSSKEFLIACGEGALKLLEVQLEGKKALPASEFLKGISIDKFKLI